MDFVLHHGVVFSLRLSQQKEFLGCTNLSLSQAAFGLCTGEGGGG